jgi:acetoacetyl-CoA synthetase
MYYRHLLGDLKSERPVFGLQPLPLDGKHRISRTVEAMASDYVAEIRRVQPRGPYFIAGHSFGGLVSYEIAQQVVHEGERVDFLGLIDTIVHASPIAPEQRQSKAVRIGRRVYDYLHKLRWIRNAFLMRRRDLTIRLGRPLPYKDRPEHYDWLCVRAHRNYVPKPYSGHVTIFSSIGNSARQKARWEPLAQGGLTVLEVPAGHNDMVLPPNSRRLAEYFDACLETAEREYELVHHSR